mmetsp:Transcript_66758/g.204265  ORF Transcript_66758/g.204265 Transcript_66758/m.204265 type:complete len:796 (+) Transcript_66758:6631-9018(+)
MVQQEGVEDAGDHRHRARVGHGPPGRGPDRGVGPPHAPLQHRRGRGHGPRVHRQHLRDDLVVLLRAGLREADRRPDAEDRPVLHRHVRGRGRGLVADASEKPLHLQLARHLEGVPGHLLVEVEEGPGAHGRHPVLLPRELARLRGQAHQQRGPRVAPRQARRHAVGDLPGQAHRRVRIGAADLRGLRRPGRRREVLLGDQRLGQDEDGHGAVPRRLQQHDPRGDAARHVHGRVRARRPRLPRAAAAQRQRAAPGRRRLWAAVALAAGLLHVRVRRLPDRGRQRLRHERIQGGLEDVPHELWQQQQDHHVPLRGHADRQRADGRGHQQRAQLRRRAEPLQGGRRRRHHGGVQGGLPAGGPGAEQGERVQHVHRAGQGGRPRGPRLLAGGRRLPHAPAHVPVARELLHHRLVRGVASRSVVQRREAADDVGGSRAAEFGRHVELVQGGPPVCRGGRQAHAGDGQALHLHHAHVVLGADLLLQEGARHAPRRRGHRPHAAAEGPQRPGRRGVRRGEHGERDQGEAAGARGDEEAGGRDDGRHHRGQSQGRGHEGELHEGRVGGQGAGRRGQRHQGGRAAGPRRGAARPERRGEGAQGPEALVAAGDQGLGQPARRRAPDAGGGVRHLRDQSGEEGRPEQPREEDRGLLGRGQDGPPERPEEVARRLVRVRQGQHPRADHPEVGAVHRARGLRPRGHQEVLRGLRGAVHVDAGHAQVPLRREGGGAQAEDARRRGGELGGHHGEAAGGASGAQGRGGQVGTARGGFQRLRHEARQLGQGDGDLHHQACQRHKAHRRPGR